MVVDSDLRSITSEWVKYLLEPILEMHYQYVSPLYSRYKYDGTITNNIVYNLTRALYGLRVRQPSAETLLLWVSWQNTILSRMCGRRT